MVFEINLPFLNPRTLEQQKMICLNCETPISTRISRDFTTELCMGDARENKKGCGCIVWYPPRSDGSRDYGIRTFISRERYLKNKNKHQDRTKFITDMKKRGINVKDPVLQTSKLHRCLTHESKIEAGEYKEETNEMFERAKAQKEELEKKGVL